MAIPFNNPQIQQMVGQYYPEGLSGQPSPQQWGQRPHSPSRLGGFTNDEADWWGDYMPGVYALSDAVRAGDISEMDRAILQGSLQSMKGQGGAFDEGLFNQGLSLALDRGRHRKAVEQDRGSTLRLGEEQLGLNWQTSPYTEGMTQQERRDARHERYSEGALGERWERARNLAQGGVRDDAEYAAALGQQETAILGSLEGVRKRERSRLASSGLKSSGKMLDVAGRAERMAVGQMGDVWRDWTKQGAEQQTGIEDKRVGFQQSLQDRLAKLDLNIVPSYEQQAPASGLWQSTVGTGLDIESLQRGWGSQDFANIMSVASLITGTATNAAQMGQESFGMLTNMFGD